MPELPEVETIVRGLRRRVIGKQILRVKVGHPKTILPLTPRRFSAFVKNEEIAAVKRFGKYIHVLFAGGKALVSHLRMTGKYIYHPSPTLSEQEKKHARVVFYFTDNTLLIFQDIRIFGTIKTYAPGAEIEEKQKLGVEPLSPKLTADYLLAKAARRQIAVKPFLLDQKVIAGLGNIYVCEILFHAEISPFLPACALLPEQLPRLIEKIRAVIKLAIAKNGSSISDFRNVDEKKGSFQKMLQVYQKAGETCPRCGRGEILREVQAQRSTFYCPHCQFPIRGRQKG